MRTQGRTRILFFHQVGNRGGASTMLSNVISSLDRGRFEAIVVCPAGDVIRQFEDAGAKVEISPRPLYQFQHISGYSRFFLHPRFLQGVVMQWRDRTYWRDYIRNREADIVHLNAVTLAPMAWCAHAAGAKVLCLVQETLAPGFVGLRSSLLRYILSCWMDTAVFISEYDKRAWRCTAPSVGVVPNWVDFKQFDRTVSRTASRQAVGVPADAKIILFLGGIQPIKGTLPLLRALTLLREFRNVLLVIAGYNSAPSSKSLSLLQRMNACVRRNLGFDYHKRVREFIAENGLSNHVRFVGMSEDVVRLYAAADLVVFPATSPHQARPVLEAGAMAKPVVVSDFGNLREFVEDGVTGITTPPGDAPALALAIHRILESPALASRLGEGNYRMALAKHSRETNAPMLLAAYERLTCQ